MRTLACTLLALSLLLSATAAADSATARARFERGQALYRSGRYAAAGAAFREAFAIDARPKYLYNAAQALRRAGDCAGALELYGAFVRIAPDADSSAAAARNMERCAPAPPAPPPTAPVSQPATPAPPPEAPAAMQPPATVHATPPPAPVPTVLVAPAVASTTARRGATRPRLAALGGATAGAALVTAAILEATAAARFDELSRTCAPRCPAADVAPLRRQLDAATGLFVAGGLVATAAVIAVVVARAHAHAARIGR